MSNSHIWRLSSLTTDYLRPRRLQLGGTRQRGSARSSRLLTTSLYLSEFTKSQCLTVQKGHVEVTETLADPLPMWRPPPLSMDPLLTSMGRSQALSLQIAACRRTVRTDGTFALNDLQDSTCGTYLYSTSAAILVTGCGDSAPRRLPTYHLARIAEPT